MPVEGTEPLEGVSDSTQRDILEVPYAEMTKTWTKLSLIAGHLWGELNRRAGCGKSTSPVL